MPTAHSPSRFRRRAGRSRRRADAAPNRRRAPNGAAAASRGRSSPSTRTWSGRSNPLAVRPGSGGWADAALPLPRAAARNHARPRRLRRAADGRLARRAPAPGATHLCRRADPRPRASISPLPRRCFSLNPLWDRLIIEAGSTHRILASVDVGLPEEHRWPRPRWRDDPPLCRHAGPRVFALPRAPIAESLLAGLDARLEGQPPSRRARRIWVNTQRMRRALVAGLARGRARLLPRIRTLGELAGPALVARRARSGAKLDLARLIAGLLRVEPGLAPETAIFDLADSLADLMDEMQGEGSRPPSSPRSTRPSTPCTGSAACASSRSWPITWRRASPPTATGGCALQRSRARRRLGRPPARPSDHGRGLDRLARGDAALHAGGRGPAAGRWSCPASTPRCPARSGTVWPRASPARPTIRSTAFAGSPTRSASTRPRFRLDRGEPARPRLATA